ncbi:hypothetical protein CRE_04173 [Caenorhabditis remanei]|uniref:VWFA domain-containing protein n=1 Tax=Caenorhabditis remanei TaxID=31234 RepID=E3MYT7_CAERE|nr:hypothetical protein CRE_04173 [Caenorhabditis remanei]
MQLLFSRRILSYVDRPCSTELSNLWLDVIIVVDNSQGMGIVRLTNVTSVEFYKQIQNVQVAANILDVFFNTSIGSNSSEPKTTCIGFITYNSNATLNVDLNKFQSSDSLFVDRVFNFLSNVAYSRDSFMGTGLPMAEQLLGRQGFGIGRDQYQNVIIVYASTYQNNKEFDPESIADRLKKS